MHKNNNKTKNPSYSKFKEDIQEIIINLIARKKNKEKFLLDSNNNMAIYYSLFYDLDFTKNKEKVFFEFKNKYKFLGEKDIFLANFFNFYFDSFSKFYTRKGSIRIKLINELLEFYYDKELNHSYIIQNLDNEEILLDTLFNLEEKIKNNKYENKNEHNISSFDYIDKKTLPQNIKELNELIFGTQNFMQECLVFENSLENENEKLNKFYNQLDFIIPIENLRSLLLLKKQNNQFFEIKEIQDEFIKDLIFTVRAFIFNYLLPDTLHLLFIDPLIQNNGLYNISTYENVEDFLNEPCYLSYKNKDLNNGDIVIEMIEDFINYLVIKNLNTNKKEIIINEELKEYYHCFLPEISSYIYQCISDIDFSFFLNTFYDKTNDFSNSLIKKTKEHEGFSHEALEEYNINVNYFVNFIDFVAENSFENDKTHIIISEDSFNIDESFFNLEEESIIMGLKQVFHYDGFIAFSRQETHNDLESKNQKTVNTIILYQIYSAIDINTNERIFYYGEIKRKNNEVANKIITHIENNLNEKYDN